tara:strand:- start:140 stop:421 length:282 start_codon:yes stop_codon:yes gene_type:complete
MENSENGPCLEQCFKCPYSVVLASNMILPIAFALIVTLVFSLNQEKLVSSFSREQREKFELARIKVLNTFICALLLGIIFMLLWKPFTLIKME